MKRTRKVTHVAEESKLTRRKFLAASLKAGAAGSVALMIGFHWPSAARADDNEESNTNPFDAWVRIDREGHVTLIVAKSEMGQGVMTSLATILADEIEVDWQNVRVEQAPTNQDVYDLGTGGSGSIFDSWLPLRQAGAAARHMLILAAAKRWHVDPATCHAQNGSVIHNPRAHSFTYGELVSDASNLPVPDLDSVSLKNPANFRYIGKALPRADVPAKVDGSATFGIDVRVPGMLYAVVARCPTFGGKVKRFDPSKAHALAGVRNVVEIPAVEDGAHTAGGVAVVADSTWAARQGRDALVIQWDNGPHANESTESLRQQLQSLTTKPGKRLVRNAGNAEAALASAHRKVEGAYELPFLAHATMEPMNCTADVRADRAEIWAPTQSPQWNQDMVAKVTGLKKESVVVHTVLMGGGFGRRYQTDFAVEAAQVSKAIGKPAQVLFTREDDMHHDFYRPAFHHRLAAALDTKGNIVAWRHRIASPPIAPYWREKAKPEESEIGTAISLPYAMGNFRLEYSPADSGVPRAWWRSVEHGTSGFAVESFVDELAAAAKMDPLEFRLRLLSTPGTFKNPLDPEGVPLDSQRFKAVLELAAAKSGWEKPLTEGRARGIACFYAFNTYVAEVAEVSVASGGKLRVHRVTAAVDCGRVVNPDGAQAQAESAIVYALSAALYGEITIGNGQVQQSNFNDYPVLRMRDMPEIDVHLMPSTHRPTGMGEPAVPPLAPAVANAIFAATRKRIRKLPIRSEDLA